jgi:hypothetical protein
MAIANKHIKELFDVLVSFVGLEHVHDLLRELKDTTAARSNQSFKDTVTKLQQYAWGDDDKFLTKPAAPKADQMGSPEGPPEGQ